MTNPSATAVAAQFDAVLREWMSPRDYALVIERNRTPEYSDCCATGDFVDSNMAMLEAFGRCGIILCDVEQDGPGGPDDNLWHTAWATWRNSR